MEANAGGADRPAAETVVVGRKSWVAYIQPVAVAMLETLVAFALTYSDFAWVGTLAYPAIALQLAYRIGVLRSERIFYDSAGVWMRWGVLPWAKGLSGVKWRDLDEAVYSQTFWSWLFRTNTVTLRHRYTKSQEIRMRQCADGRKVSARINDAHLRVIDAAHVGPPVSGGGHSAG